MIFAYLIAMTVLGFFAGKFANKAHWKWSAGLIVLALVAAILMNEAASFIFSHRMGYYRY